MLAYKYVPAAALGDLVGVVNSRRDIEPAVIVGFNKQGNMQVLFLRKTLVNLYKTPKAQRSRYSGNPVKTVAKNHLSRVVLISGKALSQEELALYSHLINNTPLP